MAKKGTESPKGSTRAKTKTPKPPAARKAEVSAPQPVAQEPKRARVGPEASGANEAPAKQSRGGADRGVPGSKKTGSRIKVTLVKSTIGFDRKQAAVVRGLGLRGLRHTVDVVDTPAMRGMIHKVRHLVVVH